MKLISIDITHFGKLSNYHYELDDSMNTICEANGYGKTTIGAFIKVMFYGFYGENKKSKNERERTKYMPWIAETYGGSITFEVNEHKYILERTFGHKASEDTVSLKDESTRLPSKDYDINKIGKELFDVDGDSFARTLLLSQNEYRENIKESSTNDIDTKIGNLVAFSNDMNNYDAAKETLTDKMSRIKTSRKKGLFDQNEALIKGLKAEITVKSDEEAKRAELEEELVRLNQLKEIRAQMDLKEKYTEILTSYNSSKVIHDDTMNYFKQLPDLDEINQYIEEAKNLSVLSSKVEENALNEDESKDLNKYQNLFDGQLFDFQIKDQIETLNEADRFINKFDLTEEEKNQLEKDRLYFQEGLDLTYLEQLLNNWIHRNDSLVTLSYTDRKLLEDGKIRFKEKVNHNDIENHIHLWQSREQYLNEIDHKERIVDQPGLTMDCLIVFLFALVLTGIGSAIFNFNHIIGSLMIIFGIVMLIIGVFQYHNHIQRKKNESVQVKKYKAKVNEIEATVQSYFALYQIDYDINNVIRDLRGLQTDYDHYTGLLQASLKMEAGKTNTSIESEINHFLSKFQYSYEENNVVNDLNNLKQKYIHYLDLKKQAENEELLRQKEIYESTKKKVDEFFSKYHYIVEEKNYSNTYHQLEDDYKTMLALEAKKEAGKEAKESLEQLEKRLKEYMVQYIPLDQTSLDHQLDEMQNRMIQFHTNEKNYQTDLHNKSAFEKEYPNYSSLISFEYQEKLNTKEEILEQIHTKQYELDKQNLKLDEIENKEGQIIYLEQANNELEQQYLLLKNTLEYLTNAKQQLDKKYREPLENALKGYLDLLEEHTDLKIDVDVNKKMSFKESGHPCDYSQLSQGYRDLVNLCFRFALVDAMYKEEKPMIILDDPLINLDDKKVEKGLALIRDLSSKYQILYLTCHTSRKEK